MAAMEVDFAPYQLRCELQGHVDDVRGICVCGDSGIATSSRDRTVRFWTVDQGDKRRYSTDKILLGHTSFVGPLAWIAPNDEFPEGGIVSGGMDTLVLVWDVARGEKVHTLKGHKLQVTGIAIDDADIVSSSVDNTLVRWRNGESVDSWQGHGSAIQAVIKLPSGEIVSGSSDTTLKLWKGKSCLHTFVGHTDTVRGLAVMDGLGILSASHDGSIRLWAISGESLMEMVGHTSIVYSVHSHTSGLVVSASEDCSAKIWKDGACVQSIEHPGCVWDAKFLKNGDIVTACSDGFVRIWTTHRDTVADAPEIDSFTSRLSQYTLSRKRVGGLKLDELPGLDSLQVPGTTDGQTKVVREGDNGVAYTWNAREQTWDKIGEVVDGPDDGMKRPVLNGVEYDYVFDVDIGDGEPVRKLPYNRSDNPYATADKWLLNENLPLSYRQQIVEFILQNSGQRDFTLDTSFRDPYTGAGAYVPGEASQKTAGLSSMPTYKHIPKADLSIQTLLSLDQILSVFFISVVYNKSRWTERGMLVFDAAQFDGILKKTLEFNNALQTDQETTTLSLTVPETGRLNAIIKTLKDTSHYHATAFGDADITLLIKMLKTWPSAMVFPVIDILRLIITHPDGASRLSKLLKNDNEWLLNLIRKATGPPASPANLLTTIRAVVNLFKDSSFHNWLLEHRSEIIGAYASCYSSSNKNAQLAFSTLLLNYAVLLIEKKHEEGQTQVLSAALEMAEDENLDADSKYRALVAIGSLMLGGLVKKIALDLDVTSIASSAKASKDKKIAEVGADIELLSKQR